jgi:phytoene synthase
MATELEQAYDHCQRVAREHAKNFYYAFRTLPSKRRRAIYAAYAFCRLCDDIADDDTSVEDKRRRFAQTRDLLAHSLAPGDDGMSRNSLPPEFTALRDATATFGIPPVYYEEVIRGVESDLVKNRFESFEELKDYCYRVASVVGLICIEVFGYDDESAKEYAVEMGLAMQLTNILRDLKEDSGRDRIYIPLDEMARFGYSEGALKRGVINDSFRGLIAFQVERARGYYASSSRLFSLVSAESRACPRVLHAAYRAILDRIESSGYDVFSRRIGLSAAEKLMIAGKLWVGGLVPSVPLFRR